MSRETRRMKVKVYGERGTGTKFLRQTLLRNGVADLWPGTIAELGLQGTVTFPGEHDMAAADRAAIREAMIDDVFARSYHLTLGWKHAAPDPERLAEAGRDTVFVVIVKNPYAWVQSMYRKPYHNLLDGNMASLATFIGFPWVCTARDNLRRHCADVIDLWNAKYGAYLDLCERREGLLVRYESLVGDADTLDRLRHHLGAPGPWSLPTTVAGTEGDLASHRDHAGREGWRDGLDGPLIDALNRRLDHDLVRRLGYAIL